MRNPFEKSDIEAIKSGSKKAWNGTKKAAVFTGTNTKKGTRGFLGFLGRSAISLEKKLADKPAEPKLTIEATDVTVK